MNEFFTAKSVLAPLYAKPFARSTPDLLAEHNVWPDIAFCRAGYAGSPATLPADLRAVSDMQRQNDRELRDELVQLRSEHRALDDEISTLEADGAIDQLTIRRLKKKKLALKDQITKIEDQLLPDIIA